MFAVTILGNNSAIPTLERHPTAQVVTVDNQLLLIDCGEGSQMQMQRYHIKRGKLNHIFISHLHGDHYFGLIGLINSLSLLGRSEDLTVYGPPELQEIIDIQLKVADTRLLFKLIFVPLVPGNGGIIMKDKEVEVSYFPVQHRIPCYGFRVKRERTKRKLIPEQAKAYEIPAAFYSRLQAGEDYQRKDGVLVKNDWVTLPPPPAQAYVYCADTKYDPGIIPYLAGANLVYHESTYLHDLEQRAADRFHSTAFQAASLAKDAGVGRLLLGHFSSKYTELGGFLEEARPVFEESYLATEGTTFLV
ncbi:ribonuclease [Chitinophaga caeni]|uniref:Ribonuclease Z n=1 Tax=Chitinophaga caeni TaxID=2029983 RepID=A0A291R0C8_9BACT|nr:ribonuclease Z [Chitinophaga caeni]ATL49648.1 ribonuclease [Chitinophaga caeni]